MFEKLGTAAKSGTKMTDEEYLRGDGGWTSTEELRTGGPVVEARLGQGEVSTGGV